jgi:hypothetical protein
MLYGPLQQIWLFFMGHCSEFGYTVWAAALDLCSKLWATKQNEAVQKIYLTILELWAKA